LAFNLSITSPEQEISAKQFLAVNLRGTFDMVAAISAQGSHFEIFVKLKDQFPTVKHRLSSIIAVSSCESQQVYSELQLQ
jgi:hypothetical protein